MASIYKARWNKAKSLALELQKKIEDATKAAGKKVIFMWNEEIITGTLHIEEDTIYIKEDNCIYGVFDDDPEIDHGSHSTIAEIKELFDEFEVYVPQSCLCGK